MKVEKNGRIVVGEGGELDLWAALEPDDRLKAASYLIGITKVSGAINSKTLETFKKKAEHKLKKIKEYEEIQAAHAY